MIDLTGDSDVDTPDIDHTTTLRANILRGFFDRSQSKSPVKPTPVPPSTPRSPQPSSSFLDMIRARRGFSVVNKQSEDTGAGGDAVGQMEEDVSSSKTHESSVTDAEVYSFFHSHFLTTHSLI
jgi:hypothetical protein